MSPMATMIAIVIITTTVTTVDVLDRRADSLSRIADSQNHDSELVPPNIDNVEPFHAMTVRVREEVWIWVRVQVRLGSGQTWFGFRSDLVRACDI